MSRNEPITLSPSASAGPTMTFRTYTMIVVGAALLIAVLVLSLQPSSMAEASTADVEGIAITEVASSKSTSKSAAGVCRDFGSKTFACAPAKTPKGSPISRLYEDGSARYKNGSKYSSDSGKFRG